MKEFSSYGLLRSIAVILLLIAAACSLDVMFKAGRNQSSVLLMVAFTAWVLSPFVALLVANVFFKRLQKTSFFLALLITVFSLVSYISSWTPPGTKTAFKFLVVPLVSWLVMAIVVLIFVHDARHILNKCCMLPT